MFGVQADISFILKGFGEFQFKNSSKIKNKKDFTKINNDVIIKTTKPLSVL
ncbi:hypothetical protein D3C71_1440990 [compost metagenome]